MFDTAVHSGIKPAIVILQRALGLEDDGIWGPKTAKAATGKVSAETVAMYWAKRALYMADMKNFDRNKNGWYKRLFMLAAINH
jgi:lysozyme family protein